MFEKKAFAKEKKNINLYIKEGKIEELSRSY